MSADTPAADQSSDSTAPTTHRLVILRHAKAESVASAPGSGDRERRLTDRGRADAAALGRWLAQSDVAPEVALVSPAVRAQQTLEAVAAQLPQAPQVQVVEGLFDADTQDVVEHLLGVPADVGTVLVVGHNPTMEETVRALQETPVEGSGDLPTSGVAVLEVPVPWADLSPGVAALVAQHVGRGQSGDS